jgi:hypothetical protein
MFASITALADRRRELDAAEAAWLNDVGEYDRSGAWSDDGFLSAASALREWCHIDQEMAQRHVRLAHRLQAIPDVADAFGRGDISAQHAAVIANAYTRKRAPELSAVEPQLIDAATICTPKVLAVFVRRVTDAIDGDDGAAADDKDYERRAFFLSQSLGGRFYLNGQCDALSGECLETAINAEMKRDLQDHDPRTTPQRRFDALVNLARLAMDRGELGETHGIRPHITAIVHVDETRVSSTLIERMRTERDRDQRLSTSTLELLMCDCTLSRVIVAGHSEVLDVGRATRTVTPAQWKALVARDRRCQAAGCNRPPSHCQAHHIVPWGAPTYGPTNLDNLQLLCWHHHRKRHAHEAQARAA